MIDQLKLKRTSTKSSICLQKNIEKNDKLKSLSMQSNNAAETISQLEFYLGFIAAKKTRY